MIEKVTIHKSNRGEIISIIRAIRDKTGCGLREAKEAYDISVCKPIELTCTKPGLGAELLALGCEVSVEQTPEQKDLVLDVIRAVKEYRSKFPRYNPTNEDEEHCAALQKLDRALAALPPEIV